MLRTKLRKAAAILMLVSFIFGTAAPAMAVAWITNDGLGYTPISKTVAASNTNTYNFLGQTWKVWKTDGSNVYFITSDIIPHGSGMSGEGYVHFNDSGTIDNYSQATIRNLVHDLLETNMINLSNRDMSAINKLSWAVISGGAGSVSQNLILNSPTEEHGVGTDHLYLLTKTDAETMPVQDILKSASGINNWWTRTGGGGTVVVFSQKSSYSWYNSKGWAFLRPALTISLKSPLFSAPLFKTISEGGKSLVNAGEGFTLSKVTPTTYKLTVVDTALAQPTITKTSVASGWDVNKLAAAAVSTTGKVMNIDDQDGSERLLVTYSGASTGSGKYLSAVLYDDAGTMQNYAKVASTASSGSGTDVKIPIKNLANGSYKVSFFSELPYGDNQVDYGSQLTTKTSFTKTGVEGEVIKTLEATYAASGLTANISNDLELIFASTSGPYDTNVSIADSKKGRITAASDGTTLTGNVSVGSGGTLTTTNAFTFKGADNQIKGVLKGGAITIGGGKTTASSAASIENVVTVSAGTLEADARALKTAVTNNATVNLTGGTLAAGKTITGTGTTNITGAEVTANANIGTAISVGASKKLTIAAGNVGGNVTNNGTVNLDTGTLEKEISGTGVTGVIGTVTANANIGTAISVGLGGHLTIAADNIGGDVNNLGAVNLDSGTLEKEISGYSGTTNIIGDVTTNAKVSTETGNYTVGESGNLTTNADYIGTSLTVNNGGIANLTSGTLANAITNNGTVNVTGSAGTDTSAQIENNTTLTLNSTGTVSGAVINNAGGTYTVTAGTQSGAVTNKALLEVNGGALTGGVANTGTINAADVTALQSAVTNTNGTLNLNGAGALNSAAVITGGDVNVNGNVNAAAANFAGGMELAIGSGLQLALSGTGTLGSGIALQGTPGTSSGILKNEGTLTAETALNYKTVNSGTLTVSAANVKNAVDNTGGTLNLGAGDLRASQYAVISGGNVSLNGEVKAAQANFGTENKVANLSVAGTGMLNLVSRTDAASKTDKIEISGNFSAVAGAGIGLDVDLSGFSNTEIEIANAKNVDSSKFDSIKATGASGVLKLGSVNVLNVPTTMSIGAYGYLKVIDTGTTANTVTFDESVTVTSEGAKYDFEQAKDSSGAVKNGYLQVLKNNGYTLYEVVTKNHGYTTDTYDLGKVKTYAIINGTWTADGATGAYDKIVEGGTGTATGTLGTLGARTGDPNEFTIQANGYDYKVGSTQAVTGITVSSGTLSLVNAGEISGWSDYVANNAGTFNLDGRTGTNTTTLKSEIKGTGTTNLTGNVAVDTGGKITQGQLNVATGAALNAGAGNLVIGTELNNSGTLTLTNGTLSCATNGITGTGTTIINGDVITTNAVTQNALTIADGKSLNMTGSGNLTVTSVVDNKGTLVIDADELKSNVKSDADTDEVILNAGTLADGYTITDGKITANGAVSANVNSLKSVGGIINNDTTGLTLTGTGSLYDNISGAAGKTIIAGTIDGNGKTITQATLEITGSLTSKADKLAVSTRIDNSGTLTLTDGTLATAANGITGTGKTIISGAVTTANAITQKDLTIENSKSLTMTGAGKNLAVTNAVDNKGTLTIGASELKSSVTNNGTANVTAGTLGEGYTISGGDVNLTGTEFNNTNLAGTVNLHSDETANAKYHFNVTGVNGNSVTMDKITVSGAATGKLNLGTATFTGTIGNPDDWVLGTTTDVQYLIGGADTSIEATGVTAFDKDEYRYTFRQKKTGGTFTAADSTWLTVTKSYAYKLWEVVRGDKGGDLPDYVLTGDYDIKDEVPTTTPTELGTLVTSARPDNSFTIVGNGYKFRDTEGTRKGITVGTGSNLTLSEISEISGWNTYAVSNAGTINLNGRTGDNVTTLDSAITGTGNMYLSGSVVAGENGKITQGTLTLADGAVLNISADSLEIADGTTNCGTINLDAGTLASAVTGGTLNFVGDVDADADYVKGTINNVTADTTLTLTAGALSEAVTGEGSIAIDGGEVTSTMANLGNTGTLSVAAGSILTLTDGTLNKAITNAGTVKLNGAGLGGAHVTAGTLEFAADLETSADYVAADTNVVVGGKALNLTGGALAKGLTNNGSVTAQSGVVINSTVTNDAATAELKEGAEFGDNGKITGGSVTLGKDVVFSAVNGEANLEGLTQLTANEALYIFDVTLGDGSGTPYVKTTMLDAAKADGMINLKRATFTADCVTAGDWLAETKQMQYLSTDAINAGSTLKIDKRIVGSNDGYRYVFTQGHEDPGNAESTVKIGYIDVYKEVAYTLKEMVNGSRGESGEDNEFVLQHDDNTSVTENLEGLNNDDREDFTIRGKNTAGDNYTLYGNGFNGIVVADPGNFGGKAGDTLNLEDIKLNNFKTVVTNKEGGIVNLNNVVFEATGTMDVVNDGTLTLKGNTVFDKGVTGNGTIATQAGYVLKGYGKDATTIAAKTLRGAGNLAVEDVTLAIGEGAESAIAGALALNGTALVKGAGRDVTAVTAGSLDLSGNVALEDITLTSLGDTTAAAGTTISGSGVDRTAVVTNTLAPTGTLNLSDITLGVENLEAADGAAYVGNGKDKAVITALNFTPAGSFNVSNITLNALNAVTAADGSVITGNGKDNAVIITDALNGAGSATLKDVTVAAQNGGNVAGTLTLDGAYFASGAETKLDGLVSANGAVKGSYSVTDTITVSDQLSLEGDTAVTTDKLVITAADGLLKGREEETETDFLTTATMTAAGNVTIKDVTVKVTETSEVEGDVILDDGTIEGGEVIIHGDLEAKPGTIGGDVTVEGTTIVDPKLVIEEDTTLHTEEVVVKGPEGTVEGKDKNTSVIDTGKITGEGDVVIEGVTTNVSGDVDIKGNLDVKDAEMNVEGDVNVGGNVDGKDSEINVKGKTTVEGDVVLDNSKINSEDITIKGTTETKNGSEIKGKVTFKGTLSFNLDGEEKKNGYVFLKVDETADLSGVTEVRLIQTDDYYKLNKGETMTLITKAANYKGEPKIEERGINGEENYKYIYSVGIENSALMLGYVAKGAADQTKSFSEARLGASAALNSASDLVAGQAIDSAKAGELWEAFAAMGGSRSRYETGSHVDLNSTNVAAGLSKKIKDNLTLGVFVEGGNGRYTTYNEFETGNVRADGDVNYFGGGVFAKVEGKKTAKGQLHGEASFRAGHINSDYNSETFNPGESTRFDTSGAYMGAHAAVGYKWNVKGGSNVDTYVKYLWNRQNSDSPTIKDEQFDLDDINSHRLRAGVRYNSKENAKGVKFFGGLAYEYEFDGTASGHMGEYSLLEPEFKGGSGMAEVGVKYDKAGSPWKAELGVTGYTGKRDSIGANLSVWYEFGNGGKKAKPAKKAKSQAEESTPVQTAGTRDFEDLFGNRRAEIKPAKAEPATEAKKAKVQEQRKTEKVSRPDKPDTKSGEIRGLGILDSSMLISK